MIWKNKKKKIALKKEFYMEIKNTFPRFVSILLIVALGVAFFSGIRATNPDMKLTADAYYDETNLMDIRVLGSMGVTDGDLNEISKIDGVDNVMGAYTTDVICEGEDFESVIKLISTPDTINKVELLEGRMPEASYECLVDNNFFGDTGYELGDTITVKSGTEEDLEKTLNETEFTIVGVGNLSYYLSHDRGTSTIGTGTISNFAVIPKEAFALEFYTEIDITATGALELLAYTDEYDKKVDQVVDKIEKIADIRCEIRYDEVVKEVKEEIADGESEIANAIKELEEAKKELEDGEKEIEDGKIEIEKNEKKMRDSEQQILKAEKELNDGAIALEEGYQKLNDAKSKLISGQQQLADGKAKFDIQKAQFEQGKAEFKSKQLELDESKAALQLQKQSLSAMELQYDGSDPVLGAQIAQFSAMIAGYEVQISEGEKQLSEAQVEIDAAEVQFSEAAKQINENQGKLIGASIEIEENEKLLNEKQAEILEGKEKLRTARAELEKGKVALEEARLELEDGEKELKEGLVEYNREKVKADKELKDARTEIEDAKETVADLEIPEWYVLDRQYLQTYVEYGQDADRIGAIGEVFPAIFFLVAALVSLTTMTRMVEEERMQIGTLKALGYSKWDIAKKYIYYALLASFIGSVIGLIIGQKLLPWVIINAYKILYHNLPQVKTPISFYYSLTATLLAVTCTTATTILACYKELLTPPASLMRPEAPKAGKRVALEKITFLWKRLNFTRKSTIRNLFRYKKRFFMTIFGIGGCMALLLVGFGIKDSIMSIGDIQFGEIRIYDGDIQLKDDITASEKEELYNQLSGDEKILEQMSGREIIIDVGKGNVEKSSYLVVPEKTKSLDKFIVLRDRITKEPHKLTDDGVIISEKLAILLDVNVGDTIYLKDGDISRVEAEVTAITENYFMHYVYMTSSLYESLYGEQPDYNKIMINYGKNSETVEEEIQAGYMDYDGVSRISSFRETSQKVFDMLKSMDTVIYVLVIAAGMLAFVVLYNLNNININERKRELATLKVLGFYNKEVAQYVYRENILLTIIGEAVGIFMGILLHRFVIVTAEIDIMMFGREIYFNSYIYSIVLTFFFSTFINVIMYYKLKRINMIESLKSVE